MKTIFLKQTRILLYILFCIESTAQIPSLEWAIHFEGTASESGSACHIDTESNLYSAGLFMGTVDFDPGSEVNSITSYNPSSQDMYITKMSLDTNLIWVKRIGGTSSSIQSIKKLLSDDEGNIYVFGSFSNNVDFDPSDEVYTMTSTGTSLFLCKLDNNGNFVWAKKIGTPYAYIDYFSMALDSNGNVYIAGTVESFNPGLQLDLNPGIETHNVAIAENWKMFVIKLDPEGDFIWGKNTESGYVRCNYITVDDSNNLLIAGGFSGTVDFGMGGNTNTLASTNENAFIIKLTESGDIIWTKHITSQTNCGLITTDNNNAIFVGGYLFFRKYDSAGNFLWGYTGVSPINLVTDSDNNLYLNYSTNNTALHFYKYSTAGEIEWNGAIGNVFANSHFTLDNEGYLYITGRYSNNPIANIDFDPGSGNYSLPSFQGDAYICKWAQPLPCPDTYSTINLTSCDGYFEYNNEEYWESGSYQQVTENTGGCDSIITINLQLYVTLEATVTQTGTTLTANESGFHYQWINGQTGQPINGAISQSFTPSTTGYYALHISTDDGWCDAYSDPFYVQIEECDNTTSTLNILLCEGSYNYHGEVYLESGIFEQIIPNSAGCDSIVTLNLQLGLLMTAEVVQSGNTLVAQESGFFYQWVDCNNDYNPIEGATEQSFTPEVSGNYALMIATNDCSYGSSCFEVTIEDCTDSYSWETITTCEQTFVYNNIVHTTSGLYEYVVPNSAGCDSTITLTLVIEYIDFTVILSNDTLIANENGEEIMLFTDFNYDYQWLDCDNDLALIEGAISDTLVPTVSGNYAIYISSPFCSWTSPCTYISLGECSETSSSLNITTCANSYTLNDITYDTAGLHQQTLTNSAGCDSVITLNLTILDLSAEVNVFENSITAVENALSYQWLDCDNGLAPIENANEQIFVAESSGTYAVEIFGDGCSIVSECYSIAISNCANTAASLNVNTCEPIYILNGEEYAESGIYTQVIQNQAGCDSTITLHLEIVAINNTVNQNGNELTAEQEDASYQWIDCSNNTPIDNATLQTFEPAETGSYSVQITLGECSNISECVNVKIVGMLETSENIVNVYPNPTNGLVYLIGVETNSYNIKDVTGRTLFAETNSLIGRKTIDMSSYSNGVYFISIISEEQKTISTKKIVLEK